MVFILNHPSIKYIQSIELNTILYIKNANEKFVDNIGTDIKDVFERNSYLKQHPLKISLHGEVEEDYFNLSGLDTVSDIDFNTLKTDYVTDMSKLFFNCKSLEYINFRNINTYNVTNMDFMFLSCCSLEFIDLRMFNTHNVISMNSMFRHCLKLRSILFPKQFVTHKTTCISKMFMFCSSLKQLNIAGFDVSNCRDLLGLFYDCTSLRKLNLFTNTIIPRKIDFIFYNCKRLDLLNFENVHPNIISEFFNKR